MNIKVGKETIEIPEEIKGVYGNRMLITHRKEEFYLDFITQYPECGVVTARVIISPGHLKRIVRVLKENLAAYETKFGEEVEEAEEPPIIKGFQ